MSAAAMDNTAYLAHVEQVVGDRRDGLVTAYADRLVLIEGLTPEQARRYAEQLWQVAEPALLVAPGQVWQATGGTDWAAPMFTLTDRFEIATVDREEGMVGNGRGLEISIRAVLAANYRLAEWPAHCPAVVEQPEPPGEPVDEDDREPQRFNPREMAVLVQRQLDDTSDPFAGNVAMLGTGYRTVLGQDGTTPWVLLDVITYLGEHLADYRAGWDDWHDTQWLGSRIPWLVWFNEFADVDPEVDTVVAAYLGHWLYQRVRGDVVREHGGTAGDYRVTFMWAPDMADDVIPAVAGADPRQPLPVDHPLAQCDGQSALFEAEASR